MENDNTNTQPPRSAVEDLLGGLVESSTLAELKDIEKGKTQAPQEPKKGASADKDKKVADTQEEHEEEENEGEGADKNKDTDKKGKTKKVEKTESTKDEEGEEEESEEEEEEEEEQIELKNKFGLKINNKLEKKGVKTEIKSFDEIPTVLKTKYGQDIKDVKGLSKFLEGSVDKWRSDSQNLDKVTKEKDNAMAVFEQLPPDLLDAVKLHYQGEDFRKAFEGNVRIDYSKPVEKQKSKTLVNAFFPGEFKDEDFEAEEPSRELQIAIKASEKEYKTEKSAREQRAKDHVENAKRKNEAYKTSVSSSVSALKSAFPDIPKDVLADVEQVMSSGALTSEFFNPDGSYKPHAAKMFMLAKHGEDLIEDLMAIAQRRGESAANEEIVKRSPSKPKDKKGGKETPLRKEVVDAVDELLPQGLTNKRVF